LSLTDRLTLLRTGFTRTFWVANVIELFERFAYYGAMAVLTIYVAEQVGLGPEKAGWLVGSLFTMLVYFLPILAGTVVDRYGFKKSLTACFSIFSVGYLLIGLGGLPAGKPLVEALGPTTYMVVTLVITAIGASLIKPSIVGTVARTTVAETKGLGYSIYYTLVNFGGAIGPLLALSVRQNLGIAYVLVMSSITSLILVAATQIFYKEPPQPADAPPARSMGKVFADMLLVFGNVRFMAFLVIFSGFWMMFWLIFLALPYYVRDVLHFEQFELSAVVGPTTIILTTVPMAALAKKLKPMTAMTMGFGLASASWFLMGSVQTALAAGAAIVVFSLGEGLQAPRYYEYVANLAPREQVGTYMGFAFLPIAIGSLVAGPLAGHLVATYVEPFRSGVPGAPPPQTMWYVVGCIGLVATFAMWLYDRLVARRPPASRPA